MDALGVIGHDRWMRLGLLLVAGALVSSACVTQPGAANEPAGATATAAVHTPGRTPTVAPAVLATSSPRPKATPTEKPRAEATARPTPTLAPTQPPTAKPADPYAAAKAAGATAICADGTWSYSKSRSGTCSKHGGVHWWTGNVGAEGPGEH